MARDENAKGRGSTGERGAAAGERDERRAGNRGERLASEADARLASNRGGRVASE